MIKKQDFIVNGMSCSNCSSLISKTLLNTNGIKECEISIINKEMSVTFEEELISIKDIENIVKSLGYNASINSNNKFNPILIRLIISVILLIILMYFANYNMLNLPMIESLKGFYINAFIQLGLTLIILIINNHYYVSGFMAIIKKSPNMDTLIMLSSFASLVYGIIKIIIYNDSIDSILYFESGAMVIVLVSVGKFLESLAMSNTTKSIKDLVKYLPKTGNLLKDYPNMDEVSVKVEDINVNDYLLVKAGEEVPCDGVVIKGTGGIDESLLTGEAILVNKEINSLVYKATILKEGYLIIKANKNGNDSIYDEIIKLVNSSSSSKTKIGKITDTICKFFVPTIVLIAIITFIIWFLVTKDFNLSFTYGLTALVISCPCALGLATPVAITCATGKAYKFYCLAKDSIVYEKLPKINYAIFDKTGTITSNNLTIGEIKNYNISLGDLNNIIVSMEKLSNHPYAKILSRLESTSLYDVTDFNSVPTKGLTGFINNKQVLIGNINLMKDYNIGVVDIIDNAIYISVNNEYSGYVTFIENIKEESFKTIELFKKNGIKTILISGDSKTKTEKIANQLNFDEYYGEVLPIDKNEYLNKYNKLGKTLYIGDGINDSIAITNAYVSMAIGTGADIAKENADVILKRNNLLDAINLYMLSKMTLRIIKENLFWAFIYNIILIPIACGAFQGIGIIMKPMYGAIAMCCSSLIVVLNALRINKYKYIDKEDDKMIISVPKMMCAMCQAKIDKALANLDGLKYEVKLETKEVVINDIATFDKKDVLNAIKNAGYECKITKK